MTRTINNEDVRNAISQAGLKYWEVADYIGLSDTRFSVKLRKKLSDDLRAKVFEAITALSN